MSTISIIGSGGMAAAIGGLAARAAHAVEVISRDPARRVRSPSRLEPERRQELMAWPRPGTSSSWPCLTPALRR